MEIKFIVVIIVLIILKKLNSILNLYFKYKLISI